MATDDDKPELTVKQLLERGLDKPLDEVVDAITAAELERWFGLPSFQQVAEGEVALAGEDPEIAAVRARRAKAVAAVDPALVEAHRRRVENVETLLRFHATIEVRVDPSVAQLDLAMVENRLAMADPRERERPEDIEDQLAEATPQALLRDLHRPELEFEKTFEVHDMAAEQRLDAVAEVNAAMATSWTLPRLGATPGREAHTLLDEVRAERRAPWRDIPGRVTLPNRRVPE
jgi:hypothetical protein